MLARLILCFQDLLHSDPIYSEHECIDRSSSIHRPLLKWIHLPDWLKYEDPHQWGYGLQVPKRVLLYCWGSSRQ